jgi:choline kinase
MQTIILAAGLGSRLGDLTATLPKALIEVNARPLIDYALLFARRAGSSHVAVVGGYCHADVAARVVSQDPGARIVENTDFRQGNILSLRAGLSGVEPRGGFLLMNTDHIYNPAIADLVREVTRAATDVTAFCDFDRTLGADDMKVQLDADRRVATMSKQLDRWDAGYVGMTFVPAAAAPRYLDAFTAVATDERANVEAILVDLARRNTPTHIADISGHGWLEIDEPHERDAAERALAANGWWR